MKEVYRDRDYTRVGYYQSVLEAEGIETFVRNQDLVTMITEVPIPDMFPALCVLNEEDFDRACQILGEFENHDRTEATEEPKKGVFFAGIFFIFGSLFFVNFVQLLSGITSDFKVPISSVILNGFLAGGSIWIIFITFKRFRLSRKAARTTETEQEQPPNPR